MQTSFQEFLREKAMLSGTKERYRNIAEWVGSLTRLVEQIHEWLRDADKDGFLEIIPYEVQRLEARLGIYDAPALKIRLGADAIDVLPVGRDAIGPLSFGMMQALRQVKGTDGPAAGRVDITNGERKYLLLRGIENGEDIWYVFEEESQVSPFDRLRLEAIIQDLLS